MPLLKRGYTATKIRDEGSLTKGTVKASSLRSRTHRLVRSWRIPTWDARRRMRAENMQIYIRIPGHDSSSCLTGLPGLLTCTNLDDQPSFSRWLSPLLPLFPLPVITIRDHK